MQANFGYFRCAPKPRDGGMEHVTVWKRSVLSGKHQRDGPLPRPECTGTVAGLITRGAAVSPRRVSASVGTMSGSFCYQAAPRTNGTSTSAISSDFFRFVVSNRNGRRISTASAAITGCSQGGSDNFGSGAMFDASHTSVPNLYRRQSRRPPAKRAKSICARGPRHGDS